jgi:3alpha(or 20beta)-hydroxysteroid dehydrogenase
MGQLDGKVAFVTGATGGIGKAITELFVKEGAKVYATGRNEEVLAEFGARHVDEVKTQSLEVTDAAAVDAAVKDCVESLGGLHVVFAGAGIESKMAPIVAVEAENFRQVMDVNVMGTFHVVKAAYGHLAGQEDGSVITMTSVAGVIGLPGMAPYVASKHAIVGFTKSLSLELASKGVRANTIAPSPVDNRMMRSIEEMTAPGAADQAKARYTTMIPAGRYAKNEEVAQMALFLASDASKFCTGGVYPVDGGFLSI